MRLIKYWHIYKILLSYMYRFINWHILKKSKKKAPFMALNNIFYKRSTPLAGL